MIGYAKIDTEKLEKWLYTEREKCIKAKETENRADGSWYDTLWHDYFYPIQSQFKDAKPLIESADSYSYKDFEDRSEKLEKLLSSLEADGQRLMVYYADQTAAIVGYQDQRFIVPSDADFIEIEMLQDYSMLTAGEIAALGDGEMSGAMLPADMTGSSIKSLEDELADKKEKIAQKEKECQQAIEEARAELERREVELRVLLEKETEELLATKKELEVKLYVLDTQIYGIRCYLGEVTDFAKIRTGDAESVDAPVVVFQKLRYLDEEMGKYLSLFAFGDFDDDKETLTQALRHRDDLRDVLCPAARCVTVLKMSRTGTHVGMSNKVENMLKEYDILHGKQLAILVRDGENLFIGWTDEDRVHITSEDAFLRPGQTTEAMLEDKTSPWRSSIEQRNKEKNKEARTESVSRYFLFSILQGIIDRGGMINIPAKTRITAESNLVKLSYAEGWLKDNTYGTLGDIIGKSKEISLKKGETILTCIHVTRDDIYYNRHAYDRNCNDRGIGYRNRTHDASIPGFRFLPINKILKDANIEITFELLQGAVVEVPGRHFVYDHAKCYCVKADPANIVKGGPYTKKVRLDEETFNKAGSSSYEKVVKSMMSNPVCAVNKEDPTKIEVRNIAESRLKSIPDLSDENIGVPRILDIKVLDETVHTYISVRGDSYSGTEMPVNMEIMKSEYIRADYLCTTWIKYVVTTGNIDGFRVNGSDLSYADALMYLNKLLEYTKKREEEDKKLIEEASGGEWIKKTPDWDRVLCEWRIENSMPKLSKRRAKQFLKEIGEI